MVEREWTSEKARAQMTERDLVWRVYTWESAPRIAAAAVRPLLGAHPPVS